MRRGIFYLALAVGILTAGLAVLPASAEDTVYCRSFWDMDTVAGLQVATVTTSQKRVNFVGQNGPNCPSASASCRQPSYLVPGDVVVADNASGDFRCVSYSSRRGVPTTNWFPADALALGQPALSADFIGSWSEGDDFIVITRARGKKLHLVGDAQYRTVGGSVNLGSFDAEVAPAGDTIVFALNYDGVVVDLAAAEQYACAVRLRRMGPYLAVADNGNCGGHNVSFNGLFIRKR